MVRAALDTNILLYAADTAGDAARHATARTILDRLGISGRGLLPLQALAEFSAVVVRKGGVPLDRAVSLIECWAEVFPTRGAEFADIADAIRVHQAHAIPFWDGMIWSVARRAGARYLLSEDLQDGRELEGVRFVNPFAKANSELIGAMLAD